MYITNASTRFATFGILGFFEFTVLSGKFELNLHGSKRVMQALCALVINAAFSSNCEGGMVKDRYDKARKAFTFFFLKSGERVTTEQISEATGWSNGTVNDYYSKMWSRWSIMKKVRPGVYSVRIPANLTEDGFIYLHSQIHNSIGSLNKN